MHICLDLILLIFFCCDKNVQKQQLKCCCLYMYEKNVYRFANFILSISISEIYLEADNP